jgi:MOSC domain-containing protein YiiM
MTRPEALWRTEDFWKGQSVVIGKLFELELKSEPHTKPGLRWGTVVAIFTGAKRLQQMKQVEEVRAIAGRGLEGDRYGNTGVPTKQITLVESEALEATARDYGFEIQPNESRRNLLTHGIALNHLVGREFQVGEVRLRGLKLCEPCTHLEGLTGKHMIKALRHRGGLRAEILEGGTIRSGDIIKEIEI